MGNLLGDMVNSMDNARVHRGTPYIDIALVWRINRLNQVPTEQAIETLYNWVRGKTITMEQFKTIIRNTNLKVVTNGR